MFLFSLVFLFLMLANSSMPAKMEKPMTVIGTNRLSHMKKNAVLSPNSQCWSDNTAGYFKISLSANWP